MKRKKRFRRERRETMRRKKRDYDKKEERLK